MTAVKEETRKFQMFVTSIQMATTTIQSGPNNEMAEVQGSLQTVPCSFRWEVPIWNPDEVNRVGMMFNTVMRLASNMSTAQLLENFAKRMKELFPGRSFLVAIGFFAIENKVTPVDDKK